MEYKNEVDVDRMDVDRMDVDRMDVDRMDVDIDIATVGSFLSSLLLQLYWLLLR
jgi:hypothetical protein